MKSGIGKIAVIACGLVGLARMAGAQPASWIYECGNIFDPTARPLSDPYLLNSVENELSTFAIGFSGTATIGGKTSTQRQLGCFLNATTVTNEGKFAISVGSTGSIQRSSANFDDDFMTITVGAPYTPMWCYACTTVDGAKTYFPANGYGDFYFGASNRYLIATANQGEILARLQIELVADATRLRWTLTNTSDVPHNVGLQWGAALGMLTDNGATSANGAQLAHWQVFTNSFRNTTPGYVYVPGRRAPEINQIIDRDSAPSEFPDYVDFVFSQEDSWGLRVENVASPDTDDTQFFNKPTEADRIVLGNHNLLLGTITTAKGTLPSGLIPDTRYLGDTAFVQRFPEVFVPAGGSRLVLHYVRNNWGVGSYALPYAAVVDAPKLIQARETDFSGNPTDEDLYPNPFKVRVWCDNVGGFGTVGEEIALQDVRVKLSFPAGSGLTIVGSAQKTLNSVPARELRFLDFDARVDGEAVGDIPYVVDISSQPGNVKKQIKGSIRVAGRPRTTLRPDANLLGVPYTFLDSSWDSVLRPFTDPNIPGGDIQVFEYDPRQQGYVISTSVRRGLGAFVIYDNAAQTSVRESYAGNPTAPNPNSTPLLQLLRGWNLIANPFNYPIYIHQFIGVPDDPNNQRAMTWQEMVDLGIVSNFAAYFNAETDQYEFVDGTEGILEPNKGYWLYVNGSDEVSLSFPQLYEEFVPGANRSRNTKPGTVWDQTDKKWRLNLVARTTTASDAQNYVGAMATSKEASQNTMFEPPMFPNQQLALFVETLKDGKPFRVAQAISERSSEMEWKVVADVKKAGEVTITWPNLGQVPKNLRFRLTDLSTGATRDLRQVSGYSFRADQPGTREFKLEVTPGNESRAVIGNVVVSRPTRDRNAPFTITYTLSGDATTSVRILSASGREVFTVSRGRADRAGENTVVWALRDSANRAVAPGTYRVEIIAETQSGERVRKVVPVNVIR